jgi:aspartyl-tRNA(Asn)/glutamyl-tRNA(Gln) amidotransferase subunit C
MSAPHHIDIDHLAKLARLALTAEEKTAYAAQLGEILAHIEKLSEVDVTGIEPAAHAFPLENVWREDVPGPALTVEDALRNAPAQRNNMISVPTVVE